MTQSRVDSRRRDVENQRRKVKSARDSMESAKKDLLKDNSAVRSARNDSHRRSREQSVQKSAEKVRAKESALAKEEAELGKRETRLLEAQAEADKERQREHQGAIKKLDDARKSYERQRVGVRRSEAGTFGRIPGSPGSGYAPLPHIAKPRGRHWDVFIAHASEDKTEIAEPLANELINQGVSVWYDKAVLRIGESLRERIDEGLAESTFGIVILSPNFFAKRWPRRELDGLTAKEDASGRKVILPVWHHISRDEVTAEGPTLAGIMAANTGVQTVAEIAHEIAVIVADERVK